MGTLGPDELDTQWKGQGRATLIEGRQDDEFANELIERKQTMFTEHTHEECVNIRDSKIFVAWRSTSSCSY